MDRQSEKSIFFDAHTHVQFQAFAGDYKEAVGRALSSGVGMVNVGTQKDTSRRAVEIAHEYENEKIFAAVGLHPIHTGKSFHDEDELGLPRTDADDTQTDAENFQRKSALNPHGSASAGFWSRAEEFDHEYYKKLALDQKLWR